MILAIASSAALAAKAATATIPIVFFTGGDPIKLGLVASFNRPGGNGTGVSTLSNALVAKQLEMVIGVISVDVAAPRSAVSEEHHGQRFHRPLPSSGRSGGRCSASATRSDCVRDLVPKAVLCFSREPEQSDCRVRCERDVQGAAHVLGLQFLVLNASIERDFETVFSTLNQRRAGALLIATDPFLNSRSERLVALAARHGLPAMHTQPRIHQGRRVMSYGSSAYRGAPSSRHLHRPHPQGREAGRPAGVQPTKFELVINLKTAKALGLEVPARLLARADEVIE